MTTMTKTKKETKYHYYLEYRRGNYFEISRGLEKRYPKMFYGSGTHLTKNLFEIHLYCTAKEYKRIVACARRRYGKIHSIERCTNKEYLGD